MWVHEEEIEFPLPSGSSSSSSSSGGNGSGNGSGSSTPTKTTTTTTTTRKLSEVINEENENVKYLPGVKLGPNVRAEPDLASSVKGADVLLICAPHQHAGRIVRGLVGAVNVKETAGGSSQKTVALSLIKGMRVRPEGPQLISAMIERVLGVETAVLMGANIAEEVARGGLTEATVAAASPATADLFVRLFSSDNFVVRSCTDRVGVEMAGTLKNVVALAVGLATVSDFFFFFFYRSFFKKKNPPKKKKKKKTGARRRRERQGRPAPGRHGRDARLCLVRRRLAPRGRRRVGVDCPGRDFLGSGGERWKERERERERTSSLLFFFRFVFHRESFERHFAGSREGEN